MIGLNKIQTGWFSFKNAVGLGDESQNNAALQSLQNDTNARMDAITKSKQEMDKANASAKAGVKDATANLKWNNKSMKDITGGLKDKLGISGIVPPTIPGATLDNSGTGDSGSGKNGKGLSKTNEAIATGGTKHNYITISFKNMVETITISGKDFRENASQLQEQVEDALMRTLASAQTASI